MDRPSTKVALEHLGRTIDVTFDGKDGSCPPSSLNGFCSFLKGAADSASAEADRFTKDRGSTAPPSTPRP